MVQNVQNRWLARANASSAARKLLSKRALGPLECLQHLLSSRAARSFRRVASSRPWRRVPTTLDGRARLQGGWRPPKVHSRPFQEFQGQIAWEKLSKSSSGSPINVRERSSKIILKTYFSVGASGVFENNRPSVTNTDYFIRQANGQRVWRK